MPTSIATFNAFTASLKELKADAYAKFGVSNTRQLRKALKGIPELAEMDLRFKKSWRQIGFHNLTWKTWKAKLQDQAGDLLSEIGESWAIQLDFRHIDGEDNAVNNIVRFQR